MAFKMKRTPIKGVVSAPSSYDIGKTMDWKYGHGDFAGIKTRRKPGESKFQYDVRMRQQSAKTVDKPSSTYQIPDPSTEITGLFTKGFGLDMGGFEPTVDPNDKRDQSDQNFGIVPGSTFGEAFAQAGRRGARSGKDIFMWNGKPFLYDFKKINGDKKEEVISPHAVDPHAMHAVDPLSGETLLTEEEKEKIKTQSKKTIHEQSIDISGVGGYIGKN